VKAASHRTRSGLSGQASRGHRQMYAAVSLDGRRRCARAGPNVAPV